MWSMANHLQINFGAISSAFAVGCHSIALDILTSTRHWKQRTRTPYQILVQTSHYIWISLFNFAEYPKN